MAIERLFIGEGVKEAEVKKYLEKELKRAGLAGIHIQRTPLVTRIVINCDRPALVIGRKGSNVKAITRIIEEDFKIEKPELEIKKVEKPNLEPAIVAYRIASALERGMNSRKVGYKALQAIMRDGAKGAEIVLSGKLVGKGGRARVLKMKAGYMKKCGYPSLEQVLHGETIATCKAGTIGVEVSVVPQNVHFPDEINILGTEDFEVEELAEGKPEKEAEKPDEEAKKEAKKGTKEGKKEDEAPKDKEPKKEKAEKEYAEGKEKPKKEPKETPKLEKREAPKETKGDSKAKEKKLETKKEKLKEEGPKAKESKPEKKEGILKKVEHAVEHAVEEIQETVDGKDKKEEKGDKKEKKEDKKKTKKADKK
jgi:small subunit ribosomal protein S3